MEVSELLTPLKTNLMPSSKDFYLSLKLEFYLLTILREAFLTTQVFAQEIILKFYILMRQGTTV